MVFNIKTDSRKVKKGDIFVAVKTACGDGHDYISKAIENGASKIVANYGSYSVETIIVDDTRKYLEEYLITNYSKYLDEMTIIGVTGTNGKSTIVSLIYQAFNMLGIPTASIGSIGYFTKEGKKCYLANTSPDICDTYEYILNAYNEGHKVIALEASSQGLSDRRLEGIKYDYAIFTNLTRDHLDIHKSFENYALAKQIMFKRVKGKAIINIDDEHSNYFLLDNNNVTFGFNDSDYQITKFNMNIDGSNFTYKHNDKLVKIHSKLVGEYNALNMMPLIIILEDMKIESSKIINIISKLEVPKGRIERIKFGTNNIFIDYAHTPDGLEKVVSTIKRVTKGNTYVVFCCRGNRDVGRRKGMMQAATDLAKLAIVTNDHIFTEDPLNVIKDMLEGLENKNYEIILDRKKAIYRGIDLLEENDSLLVLGHGHEEILINEKHEKIPFIEKDIILDYIKQKCN